MTDPNDLAIETPGWVQIGTNYKIPYQWGGFKTLSQFDQGLSNGKYAGDIATSGVSGYCVGVDCSGFVSRCWKLAYHYSTRMMDDYIAQAYSSWSQLKPADAVHKPGHVRLFVAFNPNGSLLVVEASGRDWRVSYRTYSLSNLTGYTPRYYVNMEGAPGSVPKPEFSFVTFADSVNVNWRIADTSFIAGYRVYVSSEGENWTLSQNEQMLTPEVTSTKFELFKKEAVFFKTISVSSTTDGVESFPTDMYGIYYPNSAETILIVDGFDRTSGSYPFPYHPFAMTMGKTLANYGYAFKTAANEAVVNGEINLEDYEVVIWLLGDESTRDETFNTTEQNMVKSYLQGGGKMFVTGSEIAWDLDHRGSTSDRSFIHNFLKTAYNRDDSENYTVFGKSGTIFDELVLHFDDGTKGVYQEDYPDVYSVSNGSYPAMTYSNGMIAATAYEGIIPGGTQPAKIFMMGFPFETIYTENERIALIEKVLEFFNLNPTYVKDNPIDQPKEPVLYENYPNPFNAGTSIAYRLYHEEKVVLKIFNLLGEHVKTMVNGHQSEGNYQIHWDGRNDQGKSVPTGMYVYQIQIRNFTKNRKMMLLR